MAIELRLQQKLTQQLIMTPQLQMAIKLLQLSRLELVDAIQQELEENPALEEVVEVVQEDRAEKAEKEEKAQAEEAADAKECTIEEKLNDDIDWSNYIDEYNSPGRTNFESEDKDSPRFEAFVAHKKSLSEHLLWQVMMTFSEEAERRIGSVITGSLNPDGYIDVPVEEIARMTETGPEAVENVLSVMQTFDPVGVCARDLKECLLVQARHLGIDNPLVVKIVKGHLNHLENKNYKAICRALKTNMDCVVAAVAAIRSLEPRPGRQFSDEPPQYIVPDIYVHEFEEDFVILLNDDGMPKLKVNSFYKNAIGKGEKIKGDAKEYIQDKMRSAAWLIRSIHQRQKTIYRVMESILKFQRDFFKHGISHLKPMVLRDVAQDIEMHESTISRVTTNKYAYTPQGIFELKYFFNSSINRVHGGAIASASVQDKIRQIVENENPKKPLSDDKIAAMLEKSNINIARRTVAKYREMLKILPSHKRKQF